MSPFVSILIIAFVIGMPLYGAAVAFSTLRRQRRWTPASAVVCPPPDPGRRRWIPAVARFVAFDGPAGRVVARLQWSGEGELPDGVVVPVVFDPADPTRAMLLGDPPGLLIAVALVCVAAALAIAFMLFR